MGTWIQQSRLSLLTLKGDAEMAMEEVNHFAAATAAYQIFRAVNGLPGAEPIEALSWESRGFVILVGWAGLLDIYDVETGWFICGEFWKQLPVDDDNDDELVECLQSIRGEDHGISLRAA